MKPKPPSGKKDLESVKKNKFIYLTTVGRKTGKPHTVELWFALSAGKVYLSHEGNHTDWMKNIAKSGAAHFRIGNVELDAKARIVDGGSREAGKTALYEKYYGPAAKDKVDDWFELSTVIELVPSHQPS